MSVLLSEALHAAARDTPDRTLVVDGDVRLDCATLHRRACDVAHALLARMPVGSVVAFMLPNWHEAAEFYLGATLAGMVVNPILPSLRDHELRFILDDASVRLIVIPAAFRGHDYAAMLSRVVAELDSPPEVVVVRGDPGPHLGFGSLGASHRQRALPRLDPAAVRMLMYTSGTTGRPKGVLHSHDSIGALIAQLGEHWHVAAGDAFCVPSPIAHIGGSIYAFECPLLLGTTAVLMDRWEPAAAVELMTRHRCTHMAGATPFLDGLLAATTAAGTRLPDLKVFICGGASVSPSLIRRATAAFERAIVTRVYGSTEVPVTTVGVTDRRGDPHAADTDGRPGVAEIRIVDGEIRARGPQMLRRYAQDEDNLAAFDEHGFFRTGDLGRWVDGDYLVVTGRAKDIIIRNGENISPKEVEDLLVGELGIAEVAVVGVPDARTGERACAVVVPAPGAPGPDVAAMRAHLAERGVATFKVPERVEVWDSLPKNDAGKVLKHRIRDVLVKGTRASEATG
ncbi:AMP-binding protein [Mycobacterium sp. MYCO198283]|uniref:AMP-binding protein n=1 Tax=Mycobacterium sp. MYCO198283 TaxID=2883505 RepID=UPI001E445A3E|nr:AMP-binding protein [Mycobacterium sp. MYCO198283]MCG5431100.1 AMP-binding protein [Mycobacterium sp. MYCO198283]